jgi:hypothetical protein
MIHRAIHDAMAIVERLLIAVMWKAFGGMCFVGGILILLNYPPLATVVGADIRGTLQLMLLCLMGMIVVQIIRVAYDRAVTWRRRHKLEAMEVRAGPYLAPPPMAHRPPKIPVRRLTLGISILLVSLMLNSFVIATPTRPAVVNGEVIEVSRWVVPGTGWEVRLRYLEDTAIAIFAAPDMDHIWVVRLDVDVEHIELFEDPGDWDGLLSSRLNYLVDQYANMFFAQVPAGTGTYETIEIVAGNFQDTDFQAHIKSALRGYFNFEYEGVLAIRGITLTVHCYGYNSYRRLID